MTNFEKISNMNTEDLSTFLVGFHAFPLAEYVDYEKWLNSESPDWIYKGKKANFCRFDLEGNVIGRTPCLLVKEDEVRFNRPYVGVIVNETLKFVPESYVEIV